MPLEHGRSSAVFEHNVSEMVHAGHPVKQAVAAAYQEKRESDSAGCPISGYMDAVRRGDCEGMRQHADRMNRG